MQLTADQIDIKEEVTIREETNLFSSDELIFPSGYIEGPQIRYGYKTASMHFLVPEGMVSELIQKPDIFHLPNSPSWISGLINIRGNIIPVMNLGKYLKLDTKTNHENVLVFNKFDNENTLALVIDNLPVLIEQNESSTETNNFPEVLSDYIKPGLHQDNINWIELEIQKLFKYLASNAD